MATMTLSPADDTVPRGPLSARLTPPQVWGLVLLVALSRWSSSPSWSIRSATASGWRAIRRATSRCRTIRSSLRAAVNTLVFLVIGINLKMVVALFLSGFFIQQRWWIKWLSVLFILPWAVPSIPTILSVRFMLNPEWGVVNQLIFNLTGEDGPNWLNDPTVVALSLAIVRAYLEVAAVLDPDPDRRAARHPGRPVRGRRRRRRELVAEIPLHHLAVDADALPHLHAALDDLDARRLQQRLSADRRRPGRPYPCAGRRSASATSGSTRSICRWRRSSARCRWCCRWCIS